MGDTVRMSNTTGGQPAGWHPDPSNPNGALRWWDGSRWTDHVYQGPPSSPQGQSADYWSAGGFQPQPPRPARRAWGGSRVAGPNQASFTAIGVAALYILLAVVTHFVFIGIVPVFAAIRAVRRRERLAPLAVVAAAAAVIISISAFAH